MLNNNIHTDINIHIIIKLVYIIILVLNENDYIGYNVM